MEIILDKSYLDSATKQEIHDLCGENRVLMPDVLFYELITTRETSMRNCFNKFPDFTNPVELIPNIGRLLHYELTTREACVPLYDRREKFFFNFNRRLRTGAFEFTRTQLQSRRDQEALVKRDTEEFFELAMMVAGFFPEISGIPYADLPTQIQATKTRVATDIHTVQTIYKQLSDSGEIQNPLPPETLNPNWAIFRWVQVRCLYSLDLIFKYDGRLPPVPTTQFWKKIEHDLLDSQYIILSSLSGALACDEKRMIHLFHLICPEGALYTHREKSVI